MQTQLASATFAPPPSITLMQELPLNDPALNIRGGTVQIEARLDYEGLGLLEEQIKALKLLMKPRRNAQSDVNSLEN